MDLFNLEGQTAVVTGAARGLGLSFVQVLARAHCNVAILDIGSAPTEAIESLQKEHKVTVTFYSCDISSKTTVDETIAQVEKAFGRIDINVNAAGVVSDEPFLSTSEAILDRTFNINLKGSYFVAQACAASMIARVEKARRSDPSADSGGSIVFIASISTHIPSVAQNISAYVASKDAVRGLARPLAIELAPYGITVNSLSPGYMMTDMMRGLQKQQPDLVRQFQRETLLGGGEKIGQPEDLQGPLLMLCSRRAGGWITGQDILVDGGAGSWKHPAVLGN
ncbi:Putative short-chain dehydrogenase/reductase SDR, NAD(P)-binding domain superfamily [Septoria linicola]|uniref:Short-chain dehydrogenase/reductase SDR, NAD(P)-binding domain superfamily n=1 Tax=Septoria linicola TaxID=215465 RepID=A0A9Q9AK22_9PEZI|nr:Putative short-chain dehydrogenase/reductase SDR, NAD(P)-binding domain superfamily [Septoria linicola]